VLNAETETPGSIGGESTAFRNLLSLSSTAAEKGQFSNERQAKAERKIRRKYETVPN